MNLYELYNFHKGDFDQDITEYKGYRIEISFSKEYGWEADAFDLNAEEYVFYPITQRDNSNIEEMIDLCIKRIDKKIELNNRDRDILIYE